MEIKGFNAGLTKIDTYGESERKIQFGTGTKKGNNDVEKPDTKEEKKDKSKDKDKAKKKNEYIDNLVSELLKEEGNGPRKYMDWYSGEGSGVVDWCAIFVSWIFNHNGQSKLYTGGDATAGEDIKTSMKAGYGKWYESEYTDPSTTPKKGDVVSFNWVDSEAEWGYDENGNPKKWKWITPQGSDHVAFVYKVDDEYIYTIEGNANSYDASAATVTTKKWRRDDIKINGYYRPNYEDVV